MKRMPAKDFRDVWADFPNQESCDFIPADIVETCPASILDSGS